MILHLSLPDPPSAVRLHRLRRERNDGNATDSDVAKIGHFTQQIRSSGGGGNKCVRVRVRERSKEIQSEARNTFEGSQTKYCD